MSIESVSLRGEDAAVWRAPISSTAVRSSFPAVLAGEIALRKSSVTLTAAYSNTADAMGSLPTRAGDVSRTLPWGEYRSTKLIENAAANAGRVTYSGRATAEIEAQARPFMDSIEEASSTYGIPANLIMAIIKRESDFIPTVTSSSGAMGLMQNMPFNCEAYGVTDAYDPRQSVMCGAWQLRTLLDMYDGDLRLALAGYAIGCGALRRAGVTSSDSEAYFSQVPEDTRAGIESALRNAGIIS